MSEVAPVIRSARTSDLQALARMHAALVADQARWQLEDRTDREFDHRAYFVRRLADCHRLTLVAEVAGDVVGYVDGHVGGVGAGRPLWRRVARALRERITKAAVDSTRADAYLANIFVDDRARRAGVGAALTAEFAHGVRARGAKWLHTDVLAGNDASLAMFEAAGLRVAARRMSREL